MKKKKYVDIHLLEGWDSEDRWPTLQDMSLPLEQQLEEVREDANKRLRLCDPKGLVDRKR